MTKSTITREWLQQTIAELESVRDEITFGIDTNSELELAAFKMALAAMDSEPVKRVNADQMRRVCLEANRHLDKYGAMAKEVNKLLGRIPAQPAPVVLKDHQIRELVNQLRDIAIEYHGTQQLRERIARVLRAAMLQAQSDDGEPTDDERIMAIEGIHNCERCGDEGWIVGEMGITRCACSQDGTLTSEDAKQFEPVTTANKLGNSPVIPDTWIPVSERMPENDVSVLTFDGMYKRVHHAMYGHWQCWEPEKITHWMPLPAAPQEVQGE